MNYTKIQILDRICLQYAPNANERKPQTKRTENERTLHTNDSKNARYTKQTHDTRNERTIHERTNEMKRTNYTKTQTNEHTIHETSERYTKRTHDTRTNASLERSHILSNDKRSWFYRSTI